MTEKKTIPAPTHTLDGKPLVQQSDRAGRIYYIDPKTGKRAATAGTDPDPIHVTHPKDTAKLKETRSPAVDEHDQSDTEEAPLATAQKPSDDLETVQHKYEEPKKAGVPKTLSREVFAVIGAAMANRPHQVTKGLHTARQIRDEEIVLTMPDEGGNDVQFTITLPEEFPVKARIYDGDGDW
jgi:hypothetical protein